ncbi:hypothetical protein D9758_004090 [Tetrapyrgos nigripes]|uniref:LysM domain-containing protein n=1 Tax=Tetrapyrgos nigripes TaxID=182062 RepID=A0A8H5GUR7_9AGAR|nr:hypothetical protein D9758_004090 [Tetrapyrgos nigripes]
MVLLPRVLQQIHSFALLNNPRNLDARVSCSKTILFGDLCYKIAANNGLTLAQLQSYNPGINCNKLHLGSVLNLCPSTATSTASGSTSTATGTTSMCPKTYKVKALPPPMSLLQVLPPPGRLRPSLAPLTAPQAQRRLAPLLPVPTPSLPPPTAS